MGEAFCSSRSQRNDASTTQRRSSTPRLAPRASSRRASRPIDRRFVARAACPPFVTLRIPSYPFYRARPPFSASTSFTAHSLPPSQETGGGASGLPFLPPRCQRNSQSSVHDHRSLESTGQHTACQWQCRRCTEIDRSWPDRPSNRTDLAPLASCTGMASVERGGPVGCGPVAAARGVQVAAENEFGASQRRLQVRAHTEVKPHDTHV